MYIDTPISTKGLLTNLKHNAKGYVDSKSWWGYVKTQAFYEALEKYEEAIAQGRISSLQSGALRDKAGLLGDGKPLIFNKKGNQITEEEYEKLSKKKKKQCKFFYPNREVAGYINLILEATYKKMQLMDSPEYKRDLEILNSFRNSNIRR